MSNERRGNRGLEHKRRVSASRDSVGSDSDVDLNKAINVTQLFRSGLTLASIQGKLLYCGLDVPTQILVTAQASVSEPSRGDMYLVVQRSTDSFVTTEQVAQSPEAQPLARLDIEVSPPILPSFIGHLTRYFERNEATSGLILSQGGEALPFEKSSDENQLQGNTSTVVYRNLGYTLLSFVQPEGLPSLALVLSEAVESLRTFLVSKGDSETYVMRITDGSDTLSRIVSGAGLFSASQSLGSAN